MSSTHDDPITTTDRSAWNPPDARQARREAIERAKQASPSNASADRRGKLGRDTHRWARWLHVYSSMLALLLMLFFGLTGITLNHPSWTFGDDTNITTVDGTLPFDATFADGSTDYLSISEYLRDEEGVVGTVDSFGTINGEASIAYRNPGYGADVFVDTESGDYELTVEQQGWVAVINDLHKGRDTGGAWKWLIDLSGAFLVVIAISGLTMQFFLRKRRRSAFVSVAVGIAIALALAYFALR